jgi:hypothetical protein
VGEHAPVDARLQKPPAALEVHRSQRVLAAVNVGDLEVNRLWVHGILQTPA